MIKTKLIDENGVARLVDNTKTLINSEVIKTVVIKAGNGLVETPEEGFAVCDSEGNIGMKYNTEGFDTARVSTHFLSLLGNIGGSSSLLKSVSVVENGLFLVDENYNIGCYIDSTGLHAINVPEIVTM